MPAFSNRFEEAVSGNALAAFDLGHAPVEAGVEGGALFFGELLLGLRRLRASSITSAGSW